MINQSIGRGFREGSRYKAEVDAIINRLDQYVKLYPSSLARWMSLPTRMKHAYGINFDLMTDDEFKTWLEINVV